VLFTGGGADPDRQFGHSQSQAVVFADQAELMVTGGGVIDNPGKGYSSRASTVTLSGVVVSRCDQGGEHQDSTLLVERSHFLEMPDADGRLEDDDNDALYVASSAMGTPGTKPALIRDTVFAVSEDDGIDHGGAQLTLERVWIERMTHEGVAASNGGSVTISDSVVTRCHQGIEAGWGAPAVWVDHSLIFGNDIGLRWGDEYGWANEGTLKARAVVVTGNGEANVRNFWEGGGRAEPTAIEITCSAVSSPDWDGRGGNIPGAASVTPGGCLDRAALPPGCPADPPGPRVCRETVRP
jgi:hypothetical protein